MRIPVSFLAAVLLACFGLAAVAPGSLGAQSTYQAGELPEDREATAAETAAPEASEAPDSELEETELTETEPPPVERITFTLPFADASGGGTATGSAGTLTYSDANVVVASDAVEVNYRDLRLQSDSVTVNLDTKKLVAEGHVVVDEGPKRITGRRVEFDLESKEGKFYEAQAFVDPDIYFEGRQVEKLAGDVYVVTDGTVTSCSGDEVPDWSFRLGRGRIKLDGFARVRNTRMRVKKMPVLYMPYMLFPAKRGRVAGFLFPNFGYSERRGETLGLAYFQPFGDSYDATFFADLYTEDFLGLGTEFRYQPSHATGGTLRYFSIQDSSGLFLDDPLAPDEPIPTETRWKASWFHSSKDLPFGLRGQVNYQDFSDFDFFRDFERDFNDITIRSLYSNGFLSGNWGSHSLSVLLDDRETFIRKDVLINQRQLPEIEYRLRPTRIGELPLYFSLLSSINLFEVSRTDVLEESYSRADIAPTLTIPVSTIPWLSASVGLSARTTYYENSLTEDRRAFSGDALTRTFPSASASVIGPSFSRIFDRKLGRFGKFKHVIEPRFSYLFVDEYEDQELVPLFDEVDRLQDRTIASVALVNRLLAKPANEKTGESAREIMTFELGRSFSLREEQPFEISRITALETRKSAVAMRLRFNPSERTSLELRSSYSDLLDDFSSASLLASKRFNRGSLGLSWVAQFQEELAALTEAPAEDPVDPAAEPALPLTTVGTRSHQLRLNSNLTLVRNHLTMQNSINYDFVTGFMQQQRHVFNYTSQCWGLRFEVREFKRFLGIDSAGGENFLRDRDFRIGVSLKNIGTFLDVGHGSSNRP